MTLRAGAEVEDEEEVFDFLLNDEEEEEDDDGTERDSSLVSSLKMGSIARREGGSKLGGN